MRSTSRTNALLEIEKRAFKIAIIEIRARASFSSFKSENQVSIKMSRIAGRWVKVISEAKKNERKPHRPFCMNIENVENFEPPRALPGHKGKNPK